MNYLKFTVDTRQLAGLTEALEARSISHLTQPRRGWDPTVFVWFTRDTLPGILRLLNARLPGWATFGAAWEVTPLLPRLPGIYERRA